MNSFNTLLKLPRTILRCFRSTSKSSTPSCGNANYVKTSLRLIHNGHLLPLNCKRQFSTISHNFEISTSKEDETDPLLQPDYFGVKYLVTLEDLFNARVHFGHKKGSRNEYMKPYLFGCRLDVDIIDLDQTLVHMHKALNFLAHVAFRKGMILFVMKSQKYGHLVEQLAIDCGEYAHTRRWMLGAFTNLASQKESALVGVRLPDVCVFLSLQDTAINPHTAVAESAKVGIATVGICDSNVNPTIITYPIPGNDDTQQSIELYCRLFKEAILIGKNKREEFELRKQASDDVINEPDVKSNE